jgi:hypothetical protein
MSVRGGVGRDGDFWMKYLTLRTGFRRSRNHLRTGAEAGGSDNHSHKVDGSGCTSLADVHGRMSGGMDNKTLVGG